MSTATEARPVGWSEGRAQRAQKAVDSIDAFMVGLAKLRVFLDEHGGTIPHIGEVRSLSPLMVFCSYRDDYDRIRQIAGDAGISMAPANDPGYEAVDLDFGGGARLRVFTCWQEAV